MLYFILLQRYRPEEDGIVFPVWLNVAILIIVIFCVWWSESIRIIELKKKPTFHPKKDWKSIIQCFVLDGKENPKIFFGCLSLVLFDMIIQTCPWLIYVILGIGVIGFLIYNHFKK